MPLNSFELDLIKESKRSFDLIVPLVEQSALRVLAVNDDPEVCEKLRKDLQDAGYSVDKTTSFEDAKRMLIHPKWDVLVSAPKVEHGLGEELARMATGNGMRAIVFSRSKVPGRKFFDGTISQEYDVGSLKSVISGG